MPTNNPNELLDQESALATEKATQEEFEQEKLESESTSSSSSEEENIEMFLDNLDAIKSKLPQTSINDLCNFLMALNEQRTDDSPYKARSDVLYADIAKITEDKLAKLLQELKDRYQQVSSSENPLPKLIKLYNDVCLFLENTPDYLYLDGLSELVKLEQEINHKLSEELLNIGDRFEEIYDIAEMNAEHLQLQDAVALRIQIPYIIMQINTISNPDGFSDVVTSFEKLAQEAEFLCLEYFKTMLTSAYDIDDIKTWHDYCDNFNEQ